MWGPTTRENPHTTKTIKGGNQEEAMNVVRTQLRKKEEKKNKRGSSGIPVPIK